MGDQNKPEDVYQPEAGSICSRPAERTVGLRGMGGERENRDRIGWR